jgi:SNF2 family DNA or RNA helicase
MGRAQAAAAVILPANLRKQWSQELKTLFYLPSVILETKSFNESIRRQPEPVQAGRDRALLYQFARSKETYLRQTPFDLVVIDEAHHLRNVYKKTNKIALAIKQALSQYPKVLLTATPLQNSLLELFGLVSIIDEFAFGDLQSFRARFARLSDDDDFAELKEPRHSKRTLRRQVSST